ncbi:MAG: Co2+/Mg2+ efflux protein ApaG [Deltaproteobacteria bacterium]|nr:Co2+/Mg2+ efflux protein ApaG [Deltaproteobacteria bacterium]
MYRESTHHEELQIEVQAEPAYVKEESRPDDRYFFFSYTIRIKNTGDVPAKLVSRHWIITDGTGTVREVKGEGVIGQQPRLAPGESYEYTSFCPLPTPTGNMRGSYLMVTDDGKTFEVKIPLFFLRDLGSLH